MRKSLYVPDELATAVAELDGLNWSEVLQEGLRARLGCRHHQLACAHCAAPVKRHELAGDAKRDLFLDVMEQLRPLVGRVGTAEGAARVVREVAIRHQVPGADHYPVLRPTRGQRARAAEAVVAELPREADSRRRHPTARPAPPIEPAATAALPQEAIA